MGGICLNEDLECHFVIIDEPLLGISHFLLQGTKKTKPQQSCKPRETENDQPRRATATSPMHTPAAVTHTPGHEVGEPPVVLFVEEQVADAAAEGLLVVPIVDDLQHGLGVTRP